jgi:hypothetical protein
MPSDVELWAALKDSEMWKLMERTLETRREMLFATDFCEAKTEADRARAQGAITEITRMKNFPAMALNVMMERAQSARTHTEQLDRLNGFNPDAEDYDG